MADGPHARIKRYLSDAYALEDGLVAKLTSMAADAKPVDAEISQLYTEHAAQTQRQRDRIEARLKELDDAPSSAKSLLNKVAAIGSDVANAFTNEQDKIEQSLFAAYATENFEVATYTALEAAAQTLGDEPTARLAREILEEEKATAEKLFPHIARFSRKTMLDAGAQSEEEQEENRTEYADKGYVAVK